MQKYIAFGLYNRNEHGAYQESMEPGEPKPVYLAADVHALLTRVRDAIQGDEGSVLDELNSILMVGSSHGV
jgi:hypothetical protein